MGDWPRTNRATARTDDIVSVPVFSCRMDASGVLGLLQQPRHHRRLRVAETPSADQLE